MRAVLDAFAARTGWPREGRPPLCIAHRGASAHANENTLEAFRAAAALGAQMWETDARLAADGTVVLCHDAAVEAEDGRRVVLAEQDAEALAGVALRRGGFVPTLAQAIALAVETGSGLYVEVKERAAALPALALLAASAVPFAGLGSFDHDTVRDLAAAPQPGRRFPIAVLVRLGEDPFDAAAATGAEVMHLCWERASDAPDALVTPGLIARAAAERRPLVIWHEERRAVLDRLMRLPVAGICTDRPEMMGGEAPT